MVSYNIHDESTLGTHVLCHRNVQHIRLNIWPKGAVPLTSHPSAVFIFPEFDNFSRQRIVGGICILFCNAKNNKNPDSILGTLRTPPDKLPPTPKSAINADSKLAKAQIPDAEVSHLHARDPRANPQNDVSPYIACDALFLLSSKGKTRSASVQPNGMSPDVLYRYHGLAQQDYQQSQTELTLDGFKTSASKAFRNCLSATMKVCVSQPP